MDNPFFVREIRADARHNFSSLALPMLVMALALTVPLFIAEGMAVTDIGDRRLRKLLTLLVLALCHAGACALVGWIVGGRVLQEEHRRNTLEFLRMLPLRPWQWMGPRLVYPLLALGVVWASALPFYAALVIRGHFLPRELEPLQALSLCAGFTTLGATLLMPPEGLRSLLRPETRPSAAVLLHDLSYLAVPNWIGLVLLTLAMSAIGAPAGLGGGAFRPRPFFTTWLRTDLGLALLFCPFALAAWSAACSSTAPASDRLRLFSNAARWLCIATAYYLLVGYTWANYDARLQPVVLALLPCALVVAWLWGRRALRSKSAQREDRLARWEIGRLAARLDNPVLVRDLRVTLRGAGLIRRLVLLSLGAALLCAVMGGLSLFPAVRLFAFGAGPNPTIRLLHQVAGVALVLGFASSVPCLLLLGSRAMLHWQSERRHQTLAQLLQSPLSARDIVFGRWLAGVLLGATRAVPAVALFLGGYAYLLHGRGVVVVLEMLAWLLSLGLVLSVGCAGAGRRLARAGDFLTAMPLAVTLLLAEGLGFALAMTYLSVPYADVMGKVAQTYAVVIAVLNLGLSALLYRRAVVDLEAIRHRDIE